MKVYQTIIETGGELRLKTLTDFQDIVNVKLYVWPNLFLINASQVLPQICE